MVNKTHTVKVPSIIAPIQVVALADKDGNLISSFGASANIPIAEGTVEGFSHINKFGYRDTIPNTFQTIWDGSTDYVYSAAAPVNAVADNTGSDNNGTVEVEGLDHHYAPAIETLTIGGSASTTQFVRIFRAKMIIAATGTRNVDHIRIQNSGVDEAIINPGAGQTLMALYTIPAGKTGYLLKLNGSIDANNDAFFRLYARPFGDSFNVKGQFGTFSNSITYDYPIPLQFKEKTDIQILGKAGATSELGAVFDIILIDGA